MPRDIKIQDIQFTLEDRYAEGHTLTANEALQLNQVRAENIGNNLRSKIKAALALEDEAAKATAMEAVRAEFDEYAKSYEFGATVRRSATVQQSPLEKAAEKLAKAVLIANLKASNITFKAYVADKGQEYVDAKIDEISAMEEIQAEAKKAVKESERRAKALAAITA
jgi:hypothetical protein